MPTRTATDLVEEYVHESGSWVIHRPDGKVKIPITIIDVKEAFGRTRLHCRVRGTDEYTWIDASNIQLDERS